MYDELSAGRVEFTEGEVFELAVLYPVLGAHPVRAYHWHNMQNRQDDLALIALGAAEQFQDRQPAARITLDAWNDAINGGLVLC